MCTTIIHVLGTGSGVGKSSLCLGLLAWLLKQGVPAEKLAYIKPMTQCVEKQPVTLFCEKHGIACQAIGPVIFSKGFTREFLDGQTPGRDILLDEILVAIYSIAVDKQFLFVDGVGHPAVGTTVGLSNATLANALRNCVVLLVAQSGIGAAIDSIALCLTFLRANGIAKVGVLFNKVTRPLMYELSSYVEPAVRTLFPDVEIHGFLPDVETIRRGAVPFNNVDAIADWIDENISVKQMLFPTQSKV